MSTWHRLGAESELREQAPFALKIERHRIAIFEYEGQFHAISESATTAAVHSPKAGCAGSS